jgi:hypothetical protein
MIYLANGYKKSTERAVPEIPVGKKCGIIYF